MIPYVKLQELMEKNSDNPRSSYTLLDESMGCVNGCRCGISFYNWTEYKKGSAHEDQEGFFVLEGKGYAMIGGEEMVMEPGMAFMVPAGVEHAMKCDPAYEYCKVLWFHGAI